jgi:hypothetical protein
MKTLKHQSFKLKVSEALELGDVTGTGLLEKIDDIEEKRKRQQLLHDTTHQSAFLHS